MYGCKPVDTNVNCDPGFIILWSASILALFIRLHETISSDGGLSLRPKMITVDFLPSTCPRVLGGLLLFL